MAPLVIVIELVVAALLVVALLTALLSRVPSQGLARGLVAIVAAAPFALLGLLTLALGYVELEGGVALGWFVPFLIATVVYAAVSLAIVLRGLRRDPATRAPRARSWGVRTLVAATLITFGLYLITAWNARTSLGRELAEARAEASEIALSVAPKPVPDEQNAALVYSALAERVKPDSDDEAALELWNALTDPFDLDTLRADGLEEEARAWFAAHAADAAELARATELPGAYWEHDYSDPSFDVAIPELMHVRNLAYFLQAHLRWQLLEGDTAGAVEEIRKLRRIVQHTLEGTWPTLIQVLVAAALSNIGSEWLGEVLAAGPIPPESLERLARAPHPEFREPLMRALRNERAMVLATASEVFGGSGDGDVGGFLQLLEVDDAFASFPMVVDLFTVLFLRSELRACREALDHGAEAATVELHTAREQGLLPRVEGRPKGLLAALMAPATTGCIEGVAASDAHVRVARTALAVERHRARHGAPPAQLQGLVPELLDGVPIDPFDGEPLRYRTEGDSWAVWSVGKDLEDDGGVPPEGEEDRSATGDIVLRGPSRSE